MADLSGLARLQLPQLDLGRDGSMTMEQGRRILSYLYRLNEQLRYILANLDDENLSEEVAQQIRKSYENVTNGGDTYIRVGGTGTVTERKILSAVMDYATGTIECLWDDGSYSVYTFVTDETGAVAGIAAG